eukprot:gene3005-5015_t
MLKGLVFCCSGTLSVSRKEFEKLVKSNGAGFSSSVSAKTTHLVTTPEEFSTETVKVTKAKHEGIPIVTEDYVHDSLTQGTLLDESNYSLEQKSPEKKKKKKKMSPVDERILEFYEKKRQSFIQSNINITSSEIIENVISSWNNLTSTEQGYYSTPTERYSQKLTKLYDDLMSSNADWMEENTYVFNCDCDTQILFCSRCSEKFTKSKNEHFDDILANKLKVKVTRTTELKTTPEGLDDLVVNEESIVSEKIQLLVELFSFFLDFEMGNFLNKMIASIPDETIISSSFRHIAGKLEEYPIVKINDDSISIPLMEDNFDFLKSKNKIEPKDVKISGINFLNSVDSSIIKLVKRHIAPMNDFIQTELKSVVLIENTTNVKIDQPKDESIIGKFVLFLPSFYKGGEVNIQFNEKKKTFDFSLKDTVCFQWLAFDNKCSYEIKPTTEGFGVALVFDLLDYKYVDSKMTNERMTYFVSTQNGEQSNYDEKKIGDGSVKNFFRSIRSCHQMNKTTTIILTNQYTLSTLRPEYLKGRDLELYSMLKSEFHLRFIDGIRLQIKVKQENEIPIVKKIPIGDPDEIIIHPFYESDIPKLKFIASIGKLKPHLTMQFEEEDEEEEEEEEEENYITLHYICCGINISELIKPKIRIQMFPDLQFHFE